MNTTNVDTDETPEFSEHADQPEVEKAAEAGKAPDPLAEAAKWKDTALRTQAELDNYRKRVAREREDDFKRAQMAVLDRLLPVMDNFELGMIEVRKGDPKSPIVFGMEMIERQLKEFMTGSGVEAVEAEGKKFDPNLHEAISQEENATVPEGHIVRQVRKGYKVRDRLLRAAMVVVSKGAPAA